MPDAEAAAFFFQDQAQHNEAAHAQIDEVRSAARPGGSRISSPHLQPSVRLRMHGGAASWHHLAMLRLHGGTAHEHPPAASRLTCSQAGPL